MKQLTFFLITFSVVFFRTNAFAQQEDAVFWGSINIEKKINRHFSIGFTNQYIFNQNYHELGLYYFEGGLMYKFNSNLSLSANYRFVNTRSPENFYRNRQQWYVDLSYGKGFGNFSASFRTRYQVQYYGLSFDDNYKRPGIYNRNKLTIRYKLSWYYQVFVSEEMFFNLRPLTILDSYRTFIGISRQFNIHHKLELSYGIQNQINRQNKRKDYISGLAYYYKF